MVLVFQENTWFAKRKDVRDSSTESFFSPTYFLNLIEWNDIAHSTGGTLKSYFVGGFASKFLAYNISFRNTAPPPSPKVEGAQAAALRVTGDEVAFYGCGMYGFQDTLYDHSGRHYFKECFRQGSVDYIFGNARSLYEDCTISSVTKEGDALTGYITAHGRESKKEETGFSFINCKIDGSGKVLLGRARRVYATVVFSTTYMFGVVAPERWKNWGDPNRNKTSFFGEYNCFGDGANYSSRVSFGKQLRDYEAARFMNISYINGSDWLPNHKK
ncbi:probable pectinesterase 15 [Prosopis cineraria]|uniref:probable pectinesterase 15 n=1 Tax=Prosopis cineraria TaxID=364024 RepID=UPI002410702E|nr:probable pectinesterase 15 [Prosopis cineraria]